VLFRDGSNLRGVAPDIFKRQKWKWADSARVVAWRAVLVQNRRDVAIEGHFSGSYRTSQERQAKPAGSAGFPAHQQYDTKRRYSAVLSHNY
jgi:hypothetical protein